MKKMLKNNLRKITLQKNKQKRMKKMNRKLKRKISVKPKKIFNKLLFFEKSLLIILLVFMIIYLFYLRDKFALKVGVVGVRHETNIGNNLLKYAISVKLKELGYKPYIIGVLLKRLNNVEFINRTTNLVVIKKSFSEIKEDDYDILMVNSDQTWRKFDQYFYDQGFLKFAENWTTPRFVYAASFGKDFWPYSKEEENIMKNLLT